MSLRENNTFIDYSGGFPAKNLDYKNNENMEDVNAFLNIYQINKIFI